MEQLRGLEITTTIGCRVNCRYCPQSLLLSRYYETDKNRKKFLDFEDYKKALANVQGGVRKLWRNG